MTELFNFCREANQYLGTIVVVCVIWRGLPLAITRRKASWVSRHRAMCFHVLGLYGLASAVAAIYAVNASGGAAQASVDASVASLLILVASVSTILLCIFWPHPYREDES